MSLNDRFLQFALLGSEWVLWVLVALSVLSVTVAVERFLHFRRAAKSQASLRKDAVAAWGAAAGPARGENLERLRKRVESAEGPTEHMLRGTFEAADAGHESSEDIRDAYRTAEKIQLERNLNILGTVGANAPFIGLFGTVLEILRVFNLIGESGLTPGDSSAQIMAGIAEALIATGIGLLVAIPAVVGYNAMIRWMDTILGTADEVCKVTRAALAAGEKA